MKIISWNVNGIRAVERKGDLDKFLAKHDPDIFLIQEIKAKPEQLSKELTAHPEYQQFYNPAEKPGYAGTALWVKRSFSEDVIFSTGMPNFSDNEGRIVRGDIGDMTILGVYFPNGGKSPEAWKEKLIFYTEFLNYVDHLRNEGRTVIWTGDVNCAHEEIDLARPKENKKSIGFLPEERAWVTKVIDHGWVDTFRAQYPQKIMYSWWHLISRARSRNVGWRIDYFFVDRDAFSQVQDTVYLNDQMGSDHCPVMLLMKKA